jgi:hypothetical protein
MRALGLGLAAFLGAAPAFGQEGGLIRSGEQADFSRIVMQIEPTTEWSLETSSGRATIFFPGKSIDFGTAGIFDKIPRTRITDVDVDAGAAGTRIRVKIGCDCRVSTAFVGARYLALDVSDRAPEDAADTEPDAEATASEAVGAEPAPDPAAPDRLAAEARREDADEAAGVPAADAPRLPDEAALQEAEDLARREAQADAEVFSAEEALLRQIERAAAQGLLDRKEPEPEGPVDLAAAGSGFVETQAPAAMEWPGEEETPALPLALPAPAGAAGGLAGLAAEDQIEATTVFDRYNARAEDRLRRSQLPPDCVPDYRLDIDFWAADRPLFDQLPEIRQRLYGEFDRLDPVAVNELAKLYIRFGFGAEAETLLEAFGVESPDKRLLVDLARIMDGRAVPPFGPLSRDTTCPGRHGMWLAIAGVTPAYRNAEHFATVEEAFADLPPDLRMHVGPRLIGNLLEDGHGPEARRVFDILARVGTPPTADLELITARLAAAEGEPVSAMRRMSALVENGAPNAIEALKHMVDLGLEGGYAIPDRTVTDLRTAALEHRGTADEPELRALVAKALAARGELDAAITEIRSARAALDADAYLDAVAVEILADADPERVGLANYARVVLSSEDLISGAPDNDAPREKMARNLLDLGLARAAERLVIPAAGRRSTGKLLLAKAFLTQGDTEKTRRVLTDLPGSEAADLRARSHFLDGDFAAAQAALDAAGLAEQADAMAWPSGDWSRARETAATPAEASMAQYMAARTGLAEAPEPAQDPAALDPEQAFVEPLPPLEDPSLDAARRLLATGGQLEDFIQQLLSEGTRSR